MTAVLAATAMVATATPPPASVAITDQNVSDSSSTTAAAIYTIGNDGTVKDQDSNILEAWLQGAGGSVADYGVRATQVSGVALSSGTLSTWLGCSSTNSWAVTNSAADNSTKTATLSVSIRQASSGTVLATATITLSAESFNFN